MVEHMYNLTINRDECTLYVGHYANVSGEALNVSPNNVFIGFIGDYKISDGHLRLTSSTASS